MLGKLNCQEEKGSLLLKREREIVGKVLLGSEGTLLVNLARKWMDSGQHYWWSLLGRKSALSVILSGRERALWKKSVAVWWLIQWLLLVLAPAGWGEDAAEGPGDGVQTAGREAAEGEWTNTVPQTVTSCVVAYNVYTDSLIWIRAAFFPSSFFFFFLLLHLFLLLLFLFFFNSV